MMSERHTMYDVAPGQQQQQQHAGNWQHQGQQQRQYYGNNAQQQQHQQQHQQHQQRLYEGGAQQPTDATVGQQQQQQQHQQQQAQVAAAHQVQGPRRVQGKSRTTCNFCMTRKKRCDYIEINGQKQPCTLCKLKQKECVFDMKPQRGGKRNSGGSNSPSASATASSSTARLSGAGRSKIKPSSAMVALKRARMAPSPATGLVGLEENVFVADFFDRLGFFPIASQGAIQRAIMEVLFKPAEKQLSAGGAKGRVSAATVAAAADASRAGGSDTMEGVFGGALAVRRRWESKKEESKAFSCMLWCTIALGAMTSNLNIRTVTAYVRLAQEAIDGLVSEDVPTAKAHAIMAMVYAWMDKEEQFARHLNFAKQLIQAMEDNADQEEEIPLELTDIVKELDRVLSLHYTENQEVIRRCCYTPDGEPPTMSLLMMSDSGLFHMVRYYTDGVFKAFWRDLDQRNPLLPETKKFSEKHFRECLNIEKIANTRAGLKDTGGALYIRAAMQFIRLPLKTNPRDVLMSSIGLTKVICKVPGMIRFGPLKHYVHSLVMGLARPAMAGMDHGAYETLRNMYNSLDIPGPNVVAAEDLEINNLCKHPFCKGMAWVQQEKMIRMKEAAAAAAAANNPAAAVAAARVSSPSSVGSVSSETGSSTGSSGSSECGGGINNGDTFPAAAAASSSPDLASASGGVNMVDRFPQAAAAAAAAAATAAAASGRAAPGSTAGGGGGGGNVVSDYYPTPPFSPEPSPQSQHPAMSQHSPLSQPGHQQSPSQQPRNSFRLDDPAAAPFDGMGGGPGQVCTMKREGMELYPQRGGGGGGGRDAAAAQGKVPSGMFSNGVAWHDELQQQQQLQQPRSQGQVGETLASLHPGGGPSLSAFVPGPSQHHHQRWGGGGGGGAGAGAGAPGGGASALASAPMAASAAAAAAAAAAATATAPGEAAQQHRGHGNHNSSSSSNNNNMAGAADTLPMEVGMYAQAQVQQQQSLERGENVRELRELLMENDETVPEVYQGDSDADEFAAALVAAANSSGGEGDDESLRSLEAELMLDDR